MVQTLFCSCLHLELIILVVYFDIMADNLIAIVFRLWMEKTKASYDEEIFLEIIWHVISKDLPHFSTADCFAWNHQFNFFFGGGGGKNTLHGYSQSNYHSIHLADIHQSYLVYFQVFNMLKILHIKNRLI